ncbi:MAG: hypothetical protein COV59_04695 [Candidatus Magasanikbacteria bacterium CG11_big_fil_rev_8_21_14_0_20_39_34]|uniref:Ribulose-phosphate 3-epimerase n=1 Tax=Candidatus Magasanikbacteria bacterium CG11_big_fil_rev_8_21_14_0_20_39_34 TaxID=1974653 RepID=A0A2H0N4B9_9BACT|nr:MAG: hypothetical protein COV59_04695 [Candidatus Magasanikbacteria bacterium CG11_big_fil_rev_8_21_14_0_20_39_34]
MPNILPSILVYSEIEYKKQMTSIHEVTDFVQIDIADGKFVDNTTWYDTALIKEYCPVNFELHMMVENPLEEIEKWKDIPQMKRIIFHYEAVENIVLAVEKMKTFGREVSVCLNIETPFEVLKEIINQIDGVQFMGIIAGKQGQPFQPQVLEKIQSFKKQFPAIPLSADGHVSEETIPLLFEAGIENFCVGSAIWKGDGGAQESYLRLKNIVKNLVDNR